MDARVRHRGQLGTSAFGLALAVSLQLLVSALPVHALPQSISGSLRIDAADGQYQGGDQSTLNQRYSLNWSHQMLPYLGLRSTFNYFRVGTRTGVAEESWREQIRPQGELIWTHPYFLANATMAYWKSNSVDQTTSLVRQTLGLHLSTRSTDYPLMALRVEGTNTYNSLNRSDRDTRERLYSLTLSHSFSNQRLLYESSIRESDIRSSDVQTNLTQHQLRWDQSMQPFSERLRLSSQYWFSYREEVTRSGGSVVSYYEMPVVAALGALDPSPELSTLDTLPTLVDGNTEDPVFPEIDLGESVESWNLGVDLGFPQVVNGFYVYMDRSSGSGVTWTVYTSSDNVTWDRIESAVNARFSTSFDRYEILFSGVEARYIKAVAGGVNSVVATFVTELTPLGEELTDREETRSQSSHQASTVLSYRISDAVQSSANLLLRFEPRGTFTSSRDQFYYGFSTRHSPSDYFQQSINWQAGYQSYSIGGVDQSNSSLSYSATTTPLNALSLTLAASNRQSFTGHVKDVESNGAHLRSDARLLPKLRVATDAGFTRTETPLADRRVDTWSAGTQVSAALLRSLDADVSYTYQNSDELNTDLTRERHQVTAGIQWRLTRTIQLRGSSSRLDDDHRVSTRHDYTATWQLGPRMSVSGHGSIDKGVTGAISRRWSAYYTLRLNRRTVFNSSYTVIESVAGGDEGARTLQFGVRTHF